MRAFTIIFSVLFGFTLVLQLALANLVPSAALEISPKVVGGTPISIDSAPYQVSVRMTDRDRVSFGSGHICGGVVISQRLVVTAAHCTYNSNKNKYYTAGDYVLVMGTSYLTSTTNNTLQYYVQELIPHPSYNPNTLVNDIALMFINGYIPWTSASVKALPLNTVNLAAGVNCSVTGWGVTSSGSSVSSNALRVGYVPIVSYLQCAIGYGNVPRTQLCAGYMTGGIDACQGDSGGPLMCNNALAGIVSYGYECALANYPGVYTNVSAYNAWIISTNNTLNYTVFKNGSGSLVAGIWLTLFSILLAY
ncbi:trypsin delta [Drosophila nasuta]|uniref:trypsin delta n=1 Tax=Drosophila nasuta TaxID=42062 RepID=UPI00295EA7FC|nr:trypsin delta [Drosophila nasuta]